ncbi:MAG: adenylosuccinate synthase, partial [Bacteroidales bacterium]|nr:adenylosuccinate synthase [Bacteroidales bacterium]
LMKVDVLLGLQWGDEGKGKIVDVLTPNYDIVARFQGGPNAGHTLEFNNKKFILNTIPSGIFREGATNVIGNGVIIDPHILVNKEIKSLGTETDVRSSLIISKKAHLIIPSHKLLDFVYESHKGSQKIGSTLKGIGPTYTDKAARIGLRIGDIFNPDFAQQYQNLKEAHIRIVNTYSIDFKDVKFDGMNFDEYEANWFNAVDELKKFKFENTEYFLNHALRNGKNILAEGAQGTLLDIDFGSYPFVTSSNTTTAGVCSGLGIAPSKIDKVFGIFKAYCTRVGSGPFPTELFNETGKRMQTIGNEFGSTTGRSRRCGWLDLPLLKYSCMLNGVTDLIMMKADVMNDFDEISVCNNYKIKNILTDETPFNFNEPIEAQYIKMKGWNSEIKLNHIPKELKNYMELIENETQLPISIMSYGPDREATQILKP